MEETTHLSQVTDTLYHIMLHTSPWSRFALTTPVVICTDCIGSCKSDYHTITATTSLLSLWEPIQMSELITSPSMNPSICQNLLQFRPWTHLSVRNYYSFGHQPIHLSERITVSAVNPSIGQNLLQFHPWTHPFVRNYNIVVHEPIHLSELITLSSLNLSVCQNLLHCRPWNLSVCQNLLQFRSWTHPSVRTYYSFGHEPIHLSEHITASATNPSICQKILQFRSWTHPFVKCWQQK